MKKEFLLGLGLDEQTARSILAENGKDLVREERKRREAVSGVKNAAESHLTKMRSAAEDELQRSQAETDAVLAQVRAEADEMRTAHAGELAKLTADKAAALAEQETAHLAALESLRAEHAASLTRERRRVETEVFLAEYPFVNRETREAFAAKLDAALAADPARDRAAAFESLLVNDDGCRRADVLAGADDRPRLVMPEMGAVPPGAARTLPVVL